MSYTEQEVIQELKDLYAVPRTRVRHLTDQRYYLIALLYYKFKVKEEEIFEYTELSNRSSVHHAKRKGVELFHIQEAAYIRHNKKLFEKFPYDFPDEEVKIYLKPRLHVVKFTISPAVLHQLERYTNRKAFESVDIGAKHILTNLLKLWEE
jgi:hypothetical protein